MNQPPSARPASHSAPPPVTPSLTPEEGWHCGHFYYEFDRQVLGSLPKQVVFTGCRQFCETLAVDGPTLTQRLQLSIVSGHKADFGLMLMDPDPLKIDAVHQTLRSTALGPALRATYSFISVTEVSEYVPTLEQYGQRLIEEGEEAGSPSYEAKLKAYAGREPMMRRQRLTPDFPNWPVTCFYPMNKKRKVGENWFTVPVEERQRMMSEHAKSGMSFAGKVSQLITVSAGLDDWEWGVTLWAQNPQYLKDIVYRMRFDEASARYAEFGPFYVSYLATPESTLDHCRIV